VLSLQAFVQDMWEKNKRGKAARNEQWAKDAKDGYKPVLVHTTTHSEVARLQVPLLTVTYTSLSFSLSLGKGQTCHGGKRYILFIRFFSPLLMMMIAFITIKSSLVPLIEGLCAQIYFRFEISVVCSHLLLFFFVKE